MLTAAEAIEGRWREGDRGYGTPCWIWQKSRQPSGYGQCFANGRVTFAHRASYEVHIGPIPADHQIHHHCEQRDCINPAHLETIRRDDHAGGAGHGKLTREQARRVRELARAGRPYKLIAEEYGICRTLVSLIRTGKRWAEA